MGRSIEGVRWEKRETEYVADPLALNPGQRGPDAQGHGLHL